MNIDIAALRMIEADKGISIETVITAIETAIRAGWAFRVSVSVSASPSRIRRLSASPSAMRTKRSSSTIKIFPAAEAIDSIE